MDQLSLMYPAGKEANTKTLSEETCNDLCYSISDGLISAPKS
nr:hypothetical protein [uncultured Ruminococcus sp.]